MASCRPKGNESRCGRWRLALSTANRCRRRLRGDAAAGHGRTGRGRRCRSMRWSTRWWSVRPRRQGRCRPNGVERSRRQPPICVHVPRLRSLLIALRMHRRRNIRSEPGTPSSAPVRTGRTPQRPCRTRVQNAAAMPPPWPARIPYSGLLGQCRPVLLVRVPSNGAIYPAPRAASGSVIGSPGCT